MKLQELEPKLTGGCTVVLAVIIRDTLYLANVGDSRAVLVRESNGVLVAEQLTVDHTVENEEELKRLEVLGLNPQELIKSGRLGTQENTRSIGDYSIKAGYKDVDSLRYVVRCQSVCCFHGCFPSLPGQQVVIQVLLLLI